MTSILYVGMDVHTTSYTLCCYSIEKGEIFAVVQVEPDYRNIIKYLNQIRKNYDDCHFLCGYEAGCLGYSLYHQLVKNDVDCVILAPSTMATTKKRGVKNDRRDAGNIAKCLAYNTYSPVYVLSGDDNAVREYIRMRDDEKDTLKRIKQRLLSFCTRHGKHFDEGRSYWTVKHAAWLEKLDFGNAVLQEAFREYLILYRQARDKIGVFDKRIGELANREEYAGKVKRLSCFVGIKTHSALALIVETGDFSRFPNAENYASYLGLVPGEASSGNSIHRTGITKAGNSHIRKLLVEAAQSRSKRNIAVVAVARELACFIWGMMTGNVA